MTTLERLRQGRDLAATRDADIITARDAGHTWNEITEATGLSRAMCARIYQNRPQSPRKANDPQPVRTART